MLHLCEGTITSYPRQSTKYTVLSHWSYHAAHHVIEFWEHRRNAHIKYKHMWGWFSMLTIMYGEVTNMAMKLHENYLQWINPLVMFDCLLGIQIYSALPGSPQNLWFILNLLKETPKIENSPFIDSRSSGFPIDKTKASHLQQILRLTPCANSPPAPRVSARICHTFSQFSAKPPRDVVAQISSRDHMAQADRM